MSPSVYLDNQLHQSGRYQSGGDDTLNPTIPTVDDSNIFNDIVKNMFNQTLSFMTNIGLSPVPIDENPPIQDNQLQPSPTPPPPNQPLPPNFNLNSMIKQSLAFMSGFSLAKPSVDISKLISDATKLIATIQPKIHHTGAVDMSPLVNSATSVISNIVPTTAEIDITKLVSSAKSILSALSPTNPPNHPATMFLLNDMLKKSLAFMFSIQINPDTQPNPVPKNSIQIADFIQSATELLAKLRPVIVRILRITRDEDGTFTVEPTNEIPRNAKPTTDFESAPEYLDIERASFIHTMRKLVNKFVKNNPKMTAIYLTCALQHPTNINHHVIQSVSFVRTI